MPSYRRPGVYVEETTAPSTAISGSNVALGAFLGYTLRGPVTPTLISNWQQYQMLFGGFGASTVYLPHAVFQYFNNGGRNAWVSRVTGASAAAGTKTLQDRAGTPLNTLKVDALNVGAWANTSYITVLDSGTDRFTLVLYVGGTTDANVVERWPDLSMTTTDARYCLGIVNSVVNGSTYIKLTDLASATAAPNNRPALVATVAMAGGTDVTPTTTEIGNAVANFDLVSDSLIMNLPGTVDTTTLTTLVNYAAARGDCFAVVEPTSGQTAAQAVTFAATLPVSSYAAIYWPWVYVIDPATSSPGATRLIPPGGAVVGQYCQNDTTRGVFKTPAGVDSRLPGTVGIETRQTPTDLDNLNLANVNAIRQIPGAGVVLMGGRTLQLNATAKYIAIRRSLIYIRSSLLAGTRWALFEPNDQTLWTALRINVERFLLNFWRQGGLRGLSQAEAFYVKCDSDVNTPATIADGEVHLEIGVALQYPAEFVVIKIGQRDNGATATVSL